MADDLMNLFGQFDEIFHTTERYSYRWRIRSMIRMLTTAKK